MQSKVIQGAQIQKEILLKAAEDTKSQNKMSVSQNKGSKSWWLLAIPELFLDTNTLIYNIQSFNSFLNILLPES